MGRLILTAFCFVFVILLVAGCSQNQESGGVTTNASTNSQTTGTEKGNLAPDFEVQLIDGNTFKLSNYKEQKPVLVEFWATWCPYCKRDFSVVKTIYPNYKNNVEFVAIDLDTSEDAELIKEYVEKSGLGDIKFALAKASVLSDYGVRSTTTKYAIARDGTILWKGSGDVDAATWNTILKGLEAS